MRGHCAPWRPQEPTAPSQTAPQPPSYYYFLQSKQPWGEEQVISALSLNLPHSVSLSLFQYPNNWSALSSRWPENTTPSCFFGTSTFIFSITASLFFLFLFSSHLLIHFREMSRFLYIWSHNQTNLLLFFCLINTSVNLIEIITYCWHIISHGKYNSITAWLWKNIQVS